MQRRYLCLILAAVLVILAAAPALAVPPKPPAVKKKALAACSANEVCADGAGNLKAGSALIGTSGPIVSKASCAAETSGLCIDSDDHQIYRWNGSAMVVITAVGGDEIVYQADCETILNGFCMDTDNGFLYYWDGDSVVSLWTQDVSTSGNPAWNSAHASGGNLAAANRQVTKAWQTGLPYVADLTSVIYGGRHYICTSSHTAGASTEPGIGASWATVWSEAISANPPAAANSAGVAGTIAWDANYIYVCVATNTWKRVAISTWP